MIFAEHKMIYLLPYYAFNIAVSFRTTCTKQHAAEMHSAHLSQRKSVYKTCHAFSLYEREMRKYIELKCAHSAKLDVWQYVWVQIFYYFFFRDYNKILVYFTHRLFLLNRENSLLYKRSLTLSTNCFIAV